MGATAALAIALALAAPGDLDLEAGVSSGGRTRTAAASGGSATTTAEATLAPRVSAALAGPDLGATVAYHPLLRAPELFTRSNVDVLQAGTMSARLRLDPAWQLAATAAGARGRTDLLTEGRRAPTNLETITTIQTLRYRSVRADVHLDGSPDARTTLTTSAGWFLDGGEDAASRAQFPVERGVRGEGVLSWSATRRDRLAARIDATGAELLGRTAGIAGLTGSWRRSLTPVVEGWAGGGAIGAVVRDPVAGQRGQVIPSAELGIARTDARHHLTAQVVARTGATIDRATGDVARQLETVATAGWGLARAWTLSAQGAATVVRLPSGDVRRLTAETHAVWAGIEHVTLGGGVYADWQRAAQPGLPSFYEGGLFVTVSADTAVRGPARDRPAP